MRLAIVFGLVLMLLGCGARYSYKHAGVDGTSCELVIWSAREIQAGDLRISSKCALAGGADSMTSNEKAIEVLGALINKIP